MEIEAVKNQERDDRLLALEKYSESLELKLTEIRLLLKPIAETYTTVSSMGKLLTAVAVFISIIIGIIIGLKTILMHK